jgi:microcystin-dependent protein
MNRIDITQPNGFPMQAETLGFMQSDYQSALNGLGRWFGTDKVIVSGLKRVGGSSQWSDGWIYLDGELIYFESGVPQPTFYIQTDVTSRANQSGVMVDRYFVKKARWGTSIVHPQHDFVGFERAQDVVSLQNVVGSITALDAAVILKGCMVTVGVGTISITAGFAVIDNSFYVVPTLNAAVSPQYLRVDNDSSFGVSYTGVMPSAGTFITFNPHTSQRYVDILSRQMAKPGEIKTLVALSDRFDNTGLGKWEYKGWAIANGVNGTVNLGGKTLFGYKVNDTNFDLDTTTEGGSSEVVLTTDNMPAHNHSINPSAPLGQGEFGLIQKSITGQLVTVSNADTADSGIEPNLRAAPQKIMLEGGNAPFDIIPPYRVVVFIQKI